MNPRVEDGSTTIGGVCEAYQTISSGGTYWDVAVGPNTQTVRLADSGTTTVTTSLYQTESIISLATASAYHVVTVRHPLVQILIPATASSTSTSSSGGSGLSLFGLSQLFSILCIVGGVVFVLFLIGCCYGCCCRRKKSVYYIPTKSTVCDHGRWNTCSFRSASETTCCACRDRRPGSESLTVPLRIASYCYQCQTHWHNCESSLVPLAWKTLVDLIVEEQLQRIDASACVHGGAGVFCLRCPRGSKKCCACVDTRNGLLSREERVRTYCAKCSEYYADEELVDCPPEWRLAEVQCKHARSKACTRSAQWETTCCVCTDTRHGAMPRADRTAMYCLSCASHWNAMPTSLLPPEWGIKCGHGEQYLSCKTHASRGACCACADKRPGEMPKQTRLQTGGYYCTTCSSHWQATPNHACPPEWNLRCVHNRAWADLSRPGAPCCCACKDTRVGQRLPKAERLRTYCWSCQALWRSVPDQSCPPQWQLGCKHGGMAASCMRPNPDRSSCCACADGRLKNMPKQTRTKTYCAVCESTWNAWPDAQCPPEWGLSKPRTECRHNMALECWKSAPGQVWCCACQDGRKFLSPTQRFASYCPPCQVHWPKVPAAALPAAWTVNLKDLPDRVAKEGCLPRRVMVSYGSEEETKYKKMFDEGPRYGAPRFGRDDDEEDNRPRVAELDAPSMLGGWPAPATGAGRKKFKFSKDGVDAVSAATGPPPQSPTSPASPPIRTQHTAETEAGTDYSGYEEKGLQHDGPRFSVPATVALSPQSSTPSPRQVKGPSCELPCITYPSPHPCLPFSPRFSFLPFSSPPLLSPV